MPPLTLLQLSPEKAIEFPSVTLRTATIELNLKNVSEKAVAFKIKTTAPKNYLVRPSTGILAPGESRVTQIILQPQQIIPESSTDRFLVQAVEVESTDVLLTKDFWTNVPKSLLQDHRLSVVFKAIDGSSHPPSQSPRHPRLTGIAPCPPPTLPLDSAAVVEARRPAVFPPTTSSSDFEAKYNDLLQYCLALDKQKTVANKELTEARQQVEALTQRLRAALCRNCGGRASRSPVPHKDAGALSTGSTADASASVGTIGSRHFELWPLVALIVGIVIVLKLFHVL